MSFQDLIKTEGQFWKRNVDALELGIPLKFDGNPVTSGNPLPVNIGTNINVDATITNTSIEVSNDVGNPVPVQQADLNADVDEVSTYEGVIVKFIDFASSTVTYVCEAVVGSSKASAVWRVRKITDTGTTIDIQWAGTGVFDQVANNRASLTYS